MRRIYMLLATAALIVIALIWAAIFFQLRAVRETTLQASFRQGDNFSRAMAAHFSSFAWTLDLWLRHLREEWVDAPGHFSEEVALVRKPFSNEFEFDVLVLDTAGKLVFNSLPQPPGPRPEYDSVIFQSVRGNPADRLQILGPLADPRSGATRIQFIRPILRSDGNFAGVIALSIAPDELNRIYESIDLGPTGVLTLRRPDGGVLLRSRDYEQYIQRVRKSPITDLIDAQRESGNFIRPSNTYGYDAVYSFRRLTEYSLLVVISQSLDIALADYYQQRSVYWSAGGATSFLLLVLALIIAARIRRQEIDHRQLRDSEARFRSLVELSFDTFWEQDPQFRFTSMHGAGPAWREPLRRRTLGLTRWEVGYVNVSDDDWAAHRARLLAHESFRDLELCQRSDSGREFWISTSGEPVFDES
ncbi:MAG: hypothetical protein OEW21_12055, partial [Betaproteobacteria bacterium]|nr:hypothetical protein [Betaproteobacteria bacterium]